VRPVDLAAFYAAIANEGMRPVPYVVESIEHEGQSIYRHDQTAIPINSIDHAAFYQLKTMMQGVLARGTARSIANLSPYVAGKTGTSDEENDAWFVGFTNDVTVAVWLGYDNAEGKRRTLGGGSTGGGVAVPIFEPVIQAVWANIASKTALAPPSPEAKHQLACKSIDLESGEVQRGGGITECFRVDAKGKIIDTQYRLISREGAYARGDREEINSRRESKEDRRAVRNREGSTIRVRSERAKPEGWGWSREARRGDQQWGTWHLDYGKPQ
jgi:penicillin-binding protein 1A